MRSTLLTGALLASAWLFACGQASEGHEPAEPGSLIDTELPSQEEADREAAEQIDASNAEEEYQKLLEEMEREG